MLLYLQFWTWIAAAMPFLACACPNALENLVSAPAISNLKFSSFSVGKTGRFNTQPPLPLVTNDENRSDAGVDVLFYQEQDAQRRIQTRWNDEFNDVRLHGGLRRRKNTRQIR